MNALASRYLGLDLAHPIIASASPMTATFDGMRRLEDANAAAVVMASLFEEQIRAEDTRYAMFTEYTADIPAPRRRAIFPNCLTTVTASRAISRRCGARPRRSTSR